MIKIIILEIGYFLSKLVFKIMLLEKLVFKIIILEKYSDIIFFVDKVFFSFFNSVSTLFLIFLSIVFRRIILLRMCSGCTDLRSHGRCCGSKTHDSDVSHHVVCDGCVVTVYE